MQLSVYTIITIYLVFINIAGFLIMGIDKRKAIKGAWRIPEAKLFLIAVMGGSIGSLLGMFTFHHKTKKWYFRLGMPLILILHVLLIYGISGRFNQ